MSADNHFLKSPWLYVGVATIAIFALCFWAIDRVSRPDTDTQPKVERQVIATIQSNPELIALARQQGWIQPTAEELTSIDASKVTEVGTAFVGSQLKTFDEFRFFVGLHELPGGAFAHSESLTAITLPPTIDDVKYGALAYCPSLTTIRVDSANTHYDARNDCNAVICTWKGKLMLVAGCRTTVIPDGVRYLAPQAFCGCRGLKGIDFPERFDEIGAEAFRDCADLETIVLPQGMRFVEESTFAGCTALQSVTLSKSIERLRRYAFAGCSALAAIVSPKRYPPIIEDAFDRHEATVHVPQGMLNKYSTAPGWKSFKHYKELPAK